ncbi:MAG: Lsr2 family protein [Actinomyces ruminicola]|uniref:Lsr2 protein n=1 Tax=Actinomyces ruminicola TaxID=332524 RepID=A0A1G9V7I9_9ACTO|nr:Lsr2 family protein [Actinomyces ruminicola]MBE6481523.1 Lsr2 family protein [Actinomyces ruminicola]SDM68182.1 Lsr2 protein [Actinomyces ruminicola]SDN41034.1 Lsr2 protein [Actinomyces ruminicola]
MAQKTQIVLVDDIDGSEATQTITFALDGVTYEIDLNEEHAAALRESIEEWTVKARRRGGRRTLRRRPPTGVTQKIREWARANGYEVSDRGRIPAPVREAYMAANNPANNG